MYLNSSCCSSTDDCLKIAVHMDEVMTDTTYASSEELACATLQKAFKTNDTWWQWLERPENAWRARRFDTAMKGITEIQPPATLLQREFICLYLVLILKIFISIRLGISCSEYCAGGCWWRARSCLSRNCGTSTGFYIRHRGSDLGDRQCKAGMRYDYTHILMGDDSHHIIVLGRKSA